MSCDHGCAFSGGSLGGGQHGSGKYQDFMNWMIPRGTRLEDGEVHPPVYTADGWTIPEFLGPGSKFLDKVKKGAKPVNEVDRIARVHDARYSRARPGHELEDMAIADAKMIKALDRASKEKRDYKINLAVGRYPIRAKQFLEKHKIAGKNTFTTPGEEMSADDAKLVDELIASEEMEGYGKKDLLGAIRANLRLMKKANRRAPPMPLSKAKSRLNLGGSGTRGGWIAHVRAYRSKHPDKSYKQCLRDAAKSYKR